MKVTIKYRQGSTVKAALVLVALISTSTGTGALSTRWTAIANTLKEMRRLKEVVNKNGRVEETGEEMCSLCPNGSEPSIPDASIIVHESKTLTCREMATLVASVTKASNLCDGLSSAAPICGCPSSIPTANQCEICPGGEISNPNQIMDGGGDNFTCEMGASFFKFISKDSLECEEKRKEYGDTVCECGDVVLFASEKQYNESAKISFEGPSRAPMTPSKEPSVSPLDVSWASTSDIPSVSPSDNRSVDPSVSPSTKLSENATREFSRYPSKKSSPAVSQVPSTSSWTVQGSGAPSMIELKQSKPSAMATKTTAPTTGSVVSTTMIETVKNTPNTSALSSSTSSPAESLLEGEKAIPTSDTALPNLFASRPSSPGNEEMAKPDEAASTNPVGISYSEDGDDIVFVGVVLGVLATVIAIAGILHNRRDKEKSRPRIQTTICPKTDQGNEEVLDPSDSQGNGKNDDEVDGTEGSTGTNKSHVDLHVQECPSDFSELYDTPSQMADHKYFVQHHTANFSGCDPFDFISRCHGGIKAQKKKKIKYGNADRSQGVAGAQKERRMEPLFEEP